MSDPRLLQLERILESPHFAHTERLSRFLRHVVEETVAGRGAQIKESTVGVDVFGKPAGFDPKSDSTVRSEAVKLRSRLTAFYENEGLQDACIISIPKGTYVPVFFERVPDNPPTVVPRPLPQPPQPEGTPARPRFQAWAVAAVLLGVAAAGGTWIWRSRPSETKALGQPVRITWDKGVNTDPALSAEGKLLAYASTRGSAGEQLDIWIRAVTTGSGEPMRLTSDPADDSEPDISPQGDLVAFRSERGGGGVYLVSALGGSERQLVAGGRGPRFSPDGRFIAYYTGEPALLRSAISSGRIFLIDAHGGTPPRQLASDFEVAVSPVWSMDGKSILFAGYPHKDFANIKMDWWLAAVDGSAKPRPVGFNEAMLRNNVCGAESASPRAWAGEAVLFVYSCRGTRGIARIALRGGAVMGGMERLTLGSGNESSPAMSASGVIAYASNASNTDLWSVPLARPPAPATRITEGLSDEQYPSISEDGSKLVYTSNRSGDFDVWMKHLTTGEERLLAGGPGLQTYPEISSDGATLFYTTLERDPKDPVGFNSIVWRRPVTAAASAAAKVCEHCAYMGEGPVPGRILDLDGRPIYIALREPERLESTKYLQHPKYDVFKATPSPGRKWIAFNVKQEGVLEIYAAEFGEKAGQNWVRLATGYMPVWSRDGKVLYFVSRKDGYDCIWSLRFDTATGRPAGEPEPFVHFHAADLRLAPGVDVYRWISVSRDRMVYPAAEVSSSIWMIR